MTKVINYEYIELIVPQLATATRYYFPDQPQLRFVSLMALESYPEMTTLGTTLSPLSGSKVIGVNDSLNAYLVLYYNDKESVNRLPYSQLNRTFNNGFSSQASVFQSYPFAGQQIIWAKSYIQFSTAPTGNAAAQFSIPLGVYWA